METRVLGEACQEARRIWPEEWGVHWPQISGHLDLIREHWADYWTKESINEAVMVGRWQAWGFGSKPETLNVIVLTQIIDFPANRFLQIPLAYGNELDDCLPLIDAALEKFAVEAQCDVCEIVGREGWERKLKRFKRTGVVLKARVPKRGVH